MSGLPMLQAEGIRVAYHGRAVLQNVTLAVKRGEMLGVLGANGAGKTTLLRSLAGLVSPENGQVLFEGVVLHQLPQRAQKIAYLEQQAHSHWPMTVERLVALGRVPHLRFGQSLTVEDRLAVKQALTEADVLHLRDRAATELSTGEWARVALARALSVQPQLLLVDEPVSGLDPAHQLAVMALLAQKTQQGMAVVAVLHDLPLAHRYCDRLLLLHQGRVLAQGTPQEVLTQAHLSTALGVQVLQGEHGGIPYTLPWQVV